MSNQASTLKHMEWWYVVLRVRMFIVTAKIIGYKLKLKINADDIPDGIFRAEQ